MPQLATGAGRTVRRQGRRRANAGPADSFKASVNRPTPNYQNNTNNRTPTNDCRSALNQRAANTQPNRSKLHQPQAPAPKPYPTRTKSVNGHPGEPPVIDHTNRARSASCVGPVLDPCRSRIRSNLPDVRQVAQPHVSSPLVFGIVGLVPRVCHPALRTHPLRSPASRRGLPVAGLRRLPKCHSMATEREFSWYLTHLLRTSMLCQPRRLS